MVWVGVDEGKVCLLLSMLMVGGNAVGAWVLLVIAIMDWVGMEVVGGELAGHSQVGLATQWDMSEHFLCARWEH